jgi:hypothetical protein
MDYLCYVNIDKVCTFRDSSASSGDGMKNAALKPDDLPEFIKDSWSVSPRPAQTADSLCW